MKQSLEGKIAIITGAGAGIGKTLALRLAQAGMHIALVGRTEQKLLETEKAIQSAFPASKTLVLAKDLCQEEEIQALLQETAQVFGGFDVLINNAGETLNCPFEQSTAAQFDRIMNINAKAPFLLCKYALPYLRKSNHATIINIASVVGHEAYPNQSLYGASKHALTGLTKTLAKEVYQDGIRVHLISPGGVKTEMVLRVRPDLADANLILPDDVADVALFFLEHRGSTVMDEAWLHRSDKQPF